jgi:outer membrane immunogenic protein
MRNKLISSFAGAAFSFAASGLAFAADMAVKAPPAPAPAPAPLPTWTGFYVGGNIGAGFGTFKTDFNIAPVTATGSLGPLTATFTTPGFAGRDEVYPGGFIGGGQIGYNWQLSPIWVVGLEADFQGTDQREHSTLTGNISAFTTGFVTAFVPASAVLDYQTKIEWFGTVRGRIGYLLGDGTVEVGWRSWGRRKAAISESNCGGRPPRRWTSTCHRCYSVAPTM